MSTNMIKFYFEGHSFEYEVRNALRVFDLNLDYKIENVDEVESNYKFDICKLSEDKYIKNLKQDGNYGLGLLCSLDFLSGKYRSVARLFDKTSILFEAVYDEDEILLEKEDEKKLKKVLVVKAVHNVLKKFYKFEPDYGILTGVRPVKILFTAKQNNKTDDEIQNIFQNTYEVKLDRLKLLMNVSNVEKKYISIENKNNYNLYIGVPFCPTKCNYCSFTTYVDAKKEKINKYLDVLEYEIIETIKLAIKNNLKLHTIYIGGGTPSILDVDQIDRIFNVIKKFYELSTINEITFEAGRPDTITEEKLLCLKRNFVGRISINPQTMNEDTLVKIGRKHNLISINEIFYLARKLKFDCINMDIILGLTDENESHIRKTITEVIKFNPDNITVHSLSYKRTSKLTKESEKLTKEYKTLKRMQKIVEEECYKNSYIPYYMYRQKNIKGNLENTGYTIKNKECIYNIVIIEEIETILACGAGNTSKIVFENNRHESIHNFKSLEEYEKRIDEILINKKNMIESKVIVKL